MLINRTTGSASVVPELVYPDVDEALGRLCRALGSLSCGESGGTAPA